MSNNFGPSGRSPYPTSRNNNRRRLSAELPNIEDTSTSPFLPNSHGMLRVSPSTTAQWSPAIHGVNSASGRRPRRFFDHPHAGSLEGPAIGLQQQTRKNKDGSLTSNTNEDYDVAPGRLDGTGPGSSNNTMDGINLAKLRILTKQAMGAPNVSSLPSTAVFYASLLFAKTNTQEDCFLYAQALARNGEAKRCVRLLEQCGILEPPMASSTSMRLEAVLLAAEALSNLGEWQGVLDLLEDASQLIMLDETSTDAYMPHCFPLEDDDNLAWESFFQSVDRSDAYVHPVSRLCLWRGRAYSETGHPQRAAVYWKKAIQMDSTCVEALDFLLARSVVTPQEAYEVIKNLQFESEMEWLRHLYLARIELSPQDVPFKPILSPADKSNFSPKLDINMQIQNLPTETPFALDGNSDFLDASSIQMSSPSFVQTPMVTARRQDSKFDFLGAGGSAQEKPTDDLTPAQQAEGRKEAEEGKTEMKGSTKSAIQVTVDEAFSKIWNEHKLHQSPEVLAMAARRAYRRYDLRGALDHCQQLAAIDPLCQSAGYVYISTLAALGHKRHLFRLAHEWVEASPKSARAWFAVGSYYYACERYHVAQRHFCRATRLDPHCTEAWIAFGCSFAACDESDQALASFRAAQRLSPGEYSSLLYMGMEYLRTNHVVLAQYFLNSALKASGGDPLCLNELGVLSIQRGDYDAAIEWFTKALHACVQGSLKGNEQKAVVDCIELCQEKHWEATIFNLGQCYRKTRRFAEAAYCFERCIALTPEKCSGYGALAFTKHLMGHLDEAIDLYHQALSSKPDDPFSSEMLNKALNEALSTDFPAGDDENNTPVPPKQSRLTSHTNVASPFGLKNRLGQDETFLRNNTNVSTSMMSDDGLNLTLETSDVDMSLA